MANECKKFALFACCLMTMQALRLVISTAGFCVVRFHIDCELFGIFISRLVNAVLMSQLFGNWLGDLIVFAASGSQKLIAVALTNWAELITFCSALACFCSGEQGMLTGFYWSMVLAYFFWKVGEAPAISVGVDEVDWYFAGFTLSGVWAAFLKAAVMTFVAEEKGIHSDILGDVNVSVVGDVSIVGARSVKTTVDYRAARCLFAVTIAVSSFMCLVWEAAQVTSEIGVDWVWGELVKKGTSNDDNKLVEKIKELMSDGERTVNVKDGSPNTRKLNFAGATWTSGEVSGPMITIKLNVNTEDAAAGTQGGAIDSGSQHTNTTDTEKAVKGKLEAVIDEANDSGWRKKAVKMAMLGVKLEGTVQSSQNSQVTNFTITVTVLGSGGIIPKQAMVVAGRTAIVLGAIMAVPGAMLFVALVRTFCKCFTRTVSLRTLRRWAIAGCIFAAVLTICAFGGYVGTQNEGEMWLPFFKWSGPDYKTQDQKETDWTKVAKVNAAIIGLVAGTLLGAMVGMCVGSGTGSKKRGTAAGAFIGGFFGLWIGEIVNGCLTWRNDRGKVGAMGDNGAAKGKEHWVVVCGFFIVVCGLGTVYSIYPGMAPCSITQFKYFNIIDIWILILSAIAPIFIMGIDLAEAKWRLGKTIMVGWDNGKPDGEGDPNASGRMWSAIGISALMTIATIVCEIIVLDIMQHPFSKTAQKVTNSGWRACTLTILMVSFQLTSTGIGFGCVAAGSGFNDGVYNSLSTLVLWTMECCGVLGEGYLTELKKYEPGKWPTQGMGEWATYWWWNGKAFTNAWQIWCCIGTTDLRRDIMLCRQ